MKGSIKLSIFDGKRPYEMGVVSEEVEISWAELPELITRTAYAPSVFGRTPSTSKSSGPRRCNESFVGMDLLVLDVDYGGLPDGGPLIEDAAEVFKGFSAVIAPTKNHRKPKKVKGGQTIACDRYRVIIPLSRSINRLEDFEATWQSAFEKWPFIDTQCKDAARYYDPSESVAHILEGNPFPVVERAPVRPRSSSLPELVRPQTQDEHDTFSHPSISGRGLPLSKRTNQFLTNPPHTGWRQELVAATYDAKQQGWEKEE